MAEKISQLMNWRPTTLFFYRITSTCLYKTSTLINDTTKRILYTWLLWRVETVTIFMKRKLTSVNFNKLSMQRRNCIEYRVKNLIYTHTGVMFDVTCYMSIKNVHKPRLKTTNHKINLPFKYWKLVQELHFDW